MHFTVVLCLCETGSLCSDQSDLFSATLPHWLQSPDLPPTRQVGYSGFTFADFDVLPGIEDWRKRVEAARTAIRAVPSFHHGESFEAPNPPANPFFIGGHQRLPY